MLKIAVITKNKFLNSFLSFFYKNKNKIENSTAQTFELKTIFNFSRDSLDKTSLKAKNIKIVKEINEIISDPEIDIIIDLSQNENQDYIISSIKNSKIIITTNKKIIAENYSLIKKLEKKYKTKIYYSAIFSPLALNTLVSKIYPLDEVKEINGILNAATNFILSEMKKNTISMKETIANAKKISYLVDNPEIDLTALASLYKFVLMINKVYNTAIKPADINFKGIKGITSYDLIYAEELGYNIKLIGSVKLENENLYLSLRPKLVKINSFLASVNYNSNGVEIISKFNSKNIFKAENNKNAAANLICLDLIKAAKTAVQKKNFSKNKSKNYNPIDLYSAKKSYFYIRIQIEKDKEIIEDLKNIFSKENIAELILHDDLTETPLLPVIVMTKKIYEEKLEMILKEVENLKGVLTVNNIIPVKEQ